MPVQTTKKANIYFPDGAKVSVKAKGDADYFDVGAINSAVTATLNWTESTVETANAGQLDTKISNMEIAGGFTLINLNPVGVHKMSGGIFTLEEVAAEDTVTFDVQDLANVDAGEKCPLLFVVNGHNYTLPTSATAPVISKVEDVSDPESVEELTANTDYTISKMDGAFFITFVAAATAVRITYGANSVVGKYLLHAGSSSKVLVPYSMKITHVDDNGKERSLQLYAVYGNSGGFQFNFKGANEDGVEEMPLTFTARLDTSLTSGKQLFTWAIDGGAA